MNREQVIEWAKKSAICSSASHKEFTHEGLLEFALLVAAAEREACAKVCDEARADIWPYHDEIVKETGKTVCENLAKRIRTRG